MNQERQRDYDYDPNADHGVYILFGDVNGLAGCKVGMSSYVQSRIYQVCQQCPFEMEHAIVLGAKSREHARTGERALHGMLRRYRARGEWFMFDPLDAKHKAALNTSINVVSAFHDMPKTFLRIDELRNAVDAVQASIRAKAAEDRREAKERSRQRSIIERDRNIAMKVLRDQRRRQWEIDNASQRAMALAKRTFAA